MFVFRKLDRYIINLNYHDYSSNSCIYTVNTIRSPILIYKGHSAWFYGKILTQGKYIVSLTYPSEYLIDIIYLYNPMESVDYSEFIASETGYMKLYNYHTSYDWQIKLYDSNSIICIDQKIWDKITPCFKYMKLCKIPTNL